MPAKAQRKSISKKSKSKDKTNGAEKAGIDFPPARCTRLLRQTQPTDRVSYKAGVAMAATLEYLTAELLEAAGDMASEQGFKRIKPRHIQLAVAQDDTMGSMWQGVALTQGGVLPQIEPFVEESAGRKKKRRAPKKSGIAK